MVKKGFSRKLTKLEKRKVNELKHKKKEAIKTKKKIASTLDWCNIEEVEENGIVISKGKIRYYVKGIKLYPHNIFMDEPEQQARLVNKLRICLNKCPSGMYFGFVHNPVNADDHIAELLDADRIEDDYTVKQMIDADFNKIYSFQDTFRELEFFIMIRDKDPNNLIKRYTDLFSEWKNANFLPRELNKRDYYNYIDYCFENPLINDYYFSRGMFTSLNQEYLIGAEDELCLKDDTEEFNDYGTPIKNIEKAAIVDKSKIVPTGMSIKPDYITIGDKYVAIVLVTALPKTFYLGLLCDYVNNPRIKLFMTTTKLDMNISLLLKKDYQEKLQELKKTRDPSYRSRLEMDLQSLQDYIDESIRNSDSTHNLTLAFAIYADDAKELNVMKKDLKLHLNAVGFKVANLKYMQENLYKIVNPLFIETKLPSTIADNIGIPLPSDGVAGLYPFVFETLKDKKGFLLGHELQNCGLILFDPFFYLHEKAASQLTQRINGNMVVVGTSGSGKTTAMNLIIRWFIKNKIKLMWIDPENKNEYLTKKYGGTFINWGQRNNIINIFDLKPISTEDDEDDEMMWDTELAIFNVIEDVNQILKFLYPNIKEDTLSVVGDITIRAYAKKGIKKHDDGTWTSFNDLGYDDMPTFTEFNECILEKIQELSDKPNMQRELDLLHDLRLKMVRILTEWSVFLNGHTSINFKDEQRQIISFGTKILFNKSKELREALYHIMFQFAWSLCLNDAEETAFINDEAHVTILEGTTAKLLSQFYRRARKYKTTMVMGTQEPRDFADERILTEGKAIFNNSAYKMIMNLKLDACNDVAKLVQLNDNEKQLIQDFQQGDGLFVCGDRRIPIHVIATPLELSEMGVK